MSWIFPSWTYASHGHLLAHKRFNNVDHISHCPDCRSTNHSDAKYRSLDAHTSPAQHPFIIKVARFISWHILKYLKSKFPWFCLQSEDVEQFQNAGKKGSILFVSNCDSLLDHVILAVTLTCNSRGQIPLMFVKDDVTQSSFIKSVLSMLGFCYVLDDAEKSGTVAPVISKMLSSNQNVVVPCQWWQVIQQLVDSAAKDSGMLSDVQIIPSSVSHEESSQLTEEVTAGSIIKFILRRHHTKSMIHVHFGVPYSLQKLASATYSDFESVADFDMVHLSLVHLVSFLLLTKYRHGATLVQLEDALEDLLIDIRDHNRFVGFSGSSKNVVAHAVENLRSQRLLMEPVGNHVVPNLKDLTCGEQFLRHAEKVYFMLSARAIVACAIVQCIGGSLELAKGNEGGEMSLTNLQILESGQLLHSLLACILFINSPCLSVETLLKDQIDYFSRMNLLVAEQSQYDDMRHQKLAEHVIRTSAFEEDEDDDEWGASAARESHITYQLKLSIEYASMLKSFQTMLHPFLSLLFTVTWVCKKTEGQMTTVELRDKVIERYDDGKFHYGELLSIMMLDKIIDALVGLEVLEEGDLEGVNFKYSASMTDDGLTNFLKDIVGFMKLDE